MEIANSLLRKGLPVIVAIALITIDIGFVILYLNGTGWDLDAEYNLPTYYQSLKLLITGIVIVGWATVLHRNREGKKYTASWLLGGLAMAFLALDEALQIHEQLANLFKQLLGRVTTGQPGVAVGLNFSEWLVVYAPLLFGGVVLLGVMIYSLWKMGYVAAAKTFAAAVIVLIMVPILEFAGTWGWRFDLPSYEYYVAWEEGMEMVGISLILAAMMLAFRSRHLITKPRATHPTL